MAKSEAEILEVLTKIVADETDVDPAEVTMEKHLLDDLDIDSLSMVTIVSEVEDSFDIEIPEDDADKLVVVGEVVKYVQAKLA